MISDDCGYWRDMRKHKILKINTADITIDPAKQSAMVTKACARSPIWEVTGLCQIGDSVVLSLEVDDEILSAESEYVFAPFDSEDIDEIITSIGVRYSSGYSLVGGFNVRRERWALFRRCRSFMREE